MRNVSPFLQATAKDQSIHKYFTATVLTTTCPHPKQGISEIVQIGLRINLINTNPIVAKRIAVLEENVHVYLWLVTARFRPNKA